MSYLIKLASNHSFKKKKFVVQNVNLVFLSISRVLALLNENINSCILQSINI